MMRPRQGAQAALFYEFSLEEHVPQNQLLPWIDRFVQLGCIPRLSQTFATIMVARLSIPSV